MKAIVTEAIKAAGFTLDEILGAPNASNRTNGLVDVFKASKVLEVVGEKEVTSADFSGQSGLTLTLEADGKAFHVGANCLFRAILETGKSPVFKIGISPEMKGKLKQARSLQGMKATKRAEKAEAKD
jgi:hypothetical protein